MIPFILAAVGGYLIGDSFGKDINSKIPKFAEGGTVGSEGFTITEMKELLNAKFPYSFSFRVFPLKKNTTCQPDYDYGGSALYGIEKDEFKEKLYFPQYKRDHEINYEITQGGENTYFHFLLESENGDGYSGTFGFKDRGDVGGDYITGFLVFLQEQYGLPFEIGHKVMANGGMTDGGIKMITKLNIVKRNITQLVNFYDKHNLMDVLSENALEQINKIEDAAGISKHYFDYTKYTREERLGIVREAINKLSRMIDYPNKDRLSSDYFENIGYSDMPENFRDTVEYFIENIKEASESEMANGGMMAKGGEIEKVYRFGSVKENLITDKKGNKYSIKNWVAQGYIIPFNGDKYWTHFQVPKEKWIKIEEINWSDFNISKKDFYDFLKEQREKANEVYLKYKNSFSDGGIMARGGGLNYVTKNGINFDIAQNGKTAIVVAKIEDEDNYMLDKSDLREMSESARTKGIDRVELHTNYGLELRSNENPKIVGFDSIKKKSYADGGMMAKQDREYAKGGSVKTGDLVWLMDNDGIVETLTIDTYKKSLKGFKTSDYWKQIQDDSDIKVFVSDDGKFKTIFRKKYAFADGGMMAKGGIIELTNLDTGRTEYITYSEAVKRFGKGEFEEMLQGYAPNYVAIQVDKKPDEYANGGVMSGAGRIDKTKNAFGLLSFDDLENIFEVTLFGLDEDETQKELDSLKEEWDSMKESQRRVILNDFVPNWNGMMANGGIFFTNKRNLSRDRMFKSQQSWEQKYKRKSKPRNPHYKH